MVLGFSSSNAQNSAMSFGVFGGGASYFGDVNPDNFVYNPQPLWGLLIKYNIHEFYDIKLSYMKTTLKGSYGDFDDTWSELIYDNPLLKPNSFSTDINEFGTVIEYNFLRLTNMRKAKEWSPYISSGISLLFSNKLVQSYQVTAPLNIGVKANFNSYSVGVEWSYRKTFVDDLDNWNDLDGKSEGLARYMKNNDSYHYISVFLAIGFKKCKKCHNEERDALYEIKKKKHKRKRIR